MATNPAEPKAQTMGVRPPAEDAGAAAQAAGRARSARRMTRRKQAELLLSVTNRLAAHQTLQEQLATLVDIATSALGAERGSLFLNDARSNELYSRVAHGDTQRELRIANAAGLAGYVFTSGDGVIVDDAYSDPRFNRTIDEQTGFTTRSVLSSPIRTVSGDTIGVAQALNKIDGRFTREDLELLEAMTTQAAIAIQSALYVEQIEQSREKELEFLGIVSEISSELQLGPLLQKIMRTVTKLLNAERSTLFLNDPRTNELYTEVGEGLGATKIHFPNHLGIAGTVFTTGESVSIPYAYADLRFNPLFDRQTGFFTRSILSVPVINKVGRVIGVTQVLNKIGGTFTAEDESRLKAFTAQISIGLENAKLFDDVQNMKNYNEAILESMSNGVITTDALGRVVTCSAAGFRLMRVKPTDILNRPAPEVFWGENAWIADRIKAVLEKQPPLTFMDASTRFKGETVSINLTVLPLVSVKEEKLGTMLMIDDISNEKRMKTTMSRYMDATLADKLLMAGASSSAARAAPPPCCSPTSASSPRWPRSSGRRARSTS
jgi:adenylate cyclase